MGLIIAITNAIADSPRLERGASRSAAVRTATCRDRPRPYNRRNWRRCHEQAQVVPSQIPQRHGYGIGRRRTAAPALKGQAAARSVAATAAADTATRAISVTVNGVEHQVEVEDRWTLAELLRDHLELTGTKIGCDRGECGACTVLLDGKPVYSCSQLAVWADGRSIETVEGLAKDGALDPLQQAFVEHDAPQCGFCTSGQLMSANALLRAQRRIRRPSEARAAMTGNLCRCSNYNHYVEAVVAAGAGTARGAEPRDRACQRRTATQPVAPLEDRRPPDAAHRRRRARHRQGDLHRRRPAAGHALRARPAQPAPARAHPSDRRVEGAGAARREGDLTHENCTVVWGAGSIAGGAAVQRRDQEDHEAAPLRVQQPGAIRRRAGGRRRRRRSAHRRRSAAADRRRLRGAAVRARSRRGAQARTRRKIWPEGNLVAERAQRGAADRRSAAATSTTASPRADHVFEDRYTTAFVHNAQMEPRVVRRAWEGDKLTVYTPTGGIANCRTDMARDLGIPDEKVRVVCQYMGGNFGNKNQNQDADLIAAMLAKEAGAPVKLELSRKEDFIGVHGRWPTAQYYKVGVNARRHAARRSSCAATAAWARTARTPATIGGIELYQCPNIETVVTPGLHEQDGVGELPRPGVPAGLLRHPVDDGRRRRTS